MSFFDKIFYEAETFVVNIGKLEFTLTREALPIKGFPVYWYGVLIALGFILALIYGFRNTKRYNIDQNALIDVILVGAVFSIIGARLYYVLNSGRSWTFAEIIDFRDGGLAFYGALIFAIVFGGITCKIRKVNFLSALDLAGPAFLLAQGIGRWGNFVNQEAFGTNTTLPWGMYSEKTFDYLLSHPETGADPMLPVHPCFLYESLWCLIGFILIHFLSKKRVFKGEVFLYYIVWYGFGRFLIEGLRTDSLYLFNSPIRISQAVAILCVVAGLILIFVFRRKAKLQIKESGEYSSMVIEEETEENAQNEEFIETEEIENTQDTEVTQEGECEDGTDN